MLLPHQEFLRRFEQHILPRRFVKIRHFGYLWQAGEAWPDRCSTGSGTPKTEGQNTLSDQDAGKTREGYLQMSLLRNRQDDRCLRHHGQGKPEAQALPVKSRTNVNRERVRDCCGLIRDMMKTQPQNCLWVGEPMPVVTQNLTSNPNRPAKPPM